MLKPRSPQASFYGSYLYDKIVPVDHLLRKINQVVDFSFVNDLVKDSYTPDFGRPAEDPEFMLRLCLLQYLYGDSDREVIENARINLAYKYFLGLAIDEEAAGRSPLSAPSELRDWVKRNSGRSSRISSSSASIRDWLKAKDRSSTPLISLPIWTINSLTGLVHSAGRMCCRTIEKQNPKIADKLGLKEPQYTKQDKFC